MFENRKEGFLHLTKEKEEIIVKGELLEIWNYFRLVAIQTKKDFRKLEGSKL